MATLVVLIVAFSVALAGGIVALTLLLLKMAAPADFKARPSAEGLAAEQLAPQSLEFFRREDALEGTAQPNTWQATYAGPGGQVHLTLALAGSVGEAVRALGRLRRRGSVRVVSAARLAGDHSYLVRSSQGGRIVGWTNDGWVFVARSADRALLAEFVRAFPY
jgi:hypothetical protein